MTDTTASAALEQPAARRSGLLGHEDYWAIWLGAFLLIVGLAVNYFSLPSDTNHIVEEANAVLAAEEQRAPFRTLAWHEANDKLQGLRASRYGLAKTFSDYLARPRSWSDNPVTSFITTESAAAARREAAADRLVTARERLAEARAAALAAEESAAAAGFQNPVLNRAAHDAVEQWRSARSAESSAATAANTQPSNAIVSLVVLGIGTGLLFAFGAWFIGWNVPKFLIAYPGVFLLATLAYFIAAQSDIGGLGLEYVLWAILIGLIISNTIGTPEWLKPAVQVEYYIKTGLVLLGASILIGKILVIGIPGIFVTWVVTPVVLIATFWFGQRVVKLRSKTLNIVVSADMSVSGVSAAIATAAACRAKKEELTLAVGISIIFTSIMIFAMPLVIRAIGLNDVLAGAWIGGTIDATGAVAAAGALLGNTALHVAVTIKMIQNVMIGVIAFGVAAYWATRVDRAPGSVELSFGGALREIWLRFPKFILGFLGASIVFSIIHASLGADGGRILIDNGVIRGWASGLQGWFFALAFVSIGLATNFRELSPHLKGGKPVILYLTGQSLNLVLTLLVAYVSFILVFPWVTERLLAG